MIQCCHLYIFMFFPTPASCPPNSALLGDGSCLTLYNTPSNSNSAAHFCPSVGATLPSFVDKDATLEAMRKLQDIAVRCIFHPEWLLTEPRTFFNEGMVKRATKKTITLDLISYTWATIGMVVNDLSSPHDA